MNGVTSILSLTVDQWSGQAISNASGSVIVRNPNAAEVSLIVNRNQGVWSLTMRSLTTIPVQVKIDAAWLPLGDLRGPVRILWQTGEELEARAITRDGGVITGQRIDPAGPNSFVRDRIVANLSPGQVLVATGAIGPVAMLDLNGDGFTDQSDLAVLLGEWGRSSLAADLNRDGIVGPEDLAKLLAELQPT
jgi:hypothetical protein